MSALCHFTCPDITKFLDRNGIRMNDVDPSIVGQHVRQLQNH